MARWKISAIAVAALIGAFAIAEATMAPPPSCRVVALQLRAAAARPSPADVEPGIARMADAIILRFAEFAVREGKSLRCIRYLLGL